MIVGFEQWQCISDEIGASVDMSSDNRASWGRVSKLAPFTYCSNLSWSNVVAVEVDLTPAQTFTE